MVVSPLFPGYLFAKFDMAERYRAVKYATGVLNILQFGSEPAIVDESLVEAIRDRLENGYVVIPKLNRFQKGQVVRINNGPLMGLEGVFLKEMTDQHRAILLIRTLGFHAKVSMDLDQVRMPCNA